MTDSDRDGEARADGDTRGDTATGAVTETSKTSKTSNKSTKSVTSTKGTKSKKSGAARAETMTDTAIRIAPGIAIGTASGTATDKAPDTATGTAPDTAPGIAIGTASGTATDKAPDTAIDTVCTDADPLAPGWIPPELDTTRAHPARIYEYLLGGMHYFDVDREAAETALRHIPQARAMVHENRAFLARAVRFLAESGLTQFLDLGSGLPGTGDIGEVARSVHPRARIVFVDYDPMVAVHARALVAEAEPEHTAVVLADVRRPLEVLSDPELRRVLDLGRPVAIVMSALLHFISPEEDPRDIVRAFLAAVPSGSALVVTHLTDGGHPDQAEAAIRAWDRATSQLYVRTDDEIRALFDGTEIVEPGLVPRPLWRPDGEVRGDWQQIWGLAGVGFKP